ncbi:class I SAM-dependent methyltransferase [Rhodococcus corynebacterioides]|uniref:Class I SAM-dependent methyltransferase n=2 Tax=Rhodococcoides corynebacterioides TaxID=53972 RepID=A0ABS7NZE3_9NOCA|nr:class I SAM-dependent methyltransferase [Rhodococcus corynebacterioides]MBY6408635.1 class I SAM-dependent methyltransferase [Rhodococcus corynebacterioides]
MTTAPSAALADLETRTRGHVWSDGPLEQEMLSGHLEGWFLRFLVGMTGAQDVLEIGMFTGYSALAMAEEIPRGGRVVACEVDEDVAAFARDRFSASPVGNRIDVRVGPAADTLARAARAGESFDLVFVDADKPGYAQYLDLLLTTDLLRPGGLVVVDNTLMQGEPYCGATTPNGRAIASFNQAVAADPRLEQVLIPLRDGVTLIRRARVRDEPS